MAITSSEIEKLKAEYEKRRQSMFLYVGGERTPWVYDCDVLDGGVNTYFFSRHFDVERKKEVQIAIPRDRLKISEDEDLIEFLIDPTEFKRLMHLLSFVEPGIKPTY